MLARQRSRGRAVAHESDRRCRNHDAYVGGGPMDVLFGPQRVVPVRRISNEYATGLGARGRPFVDRKARSWLQEYIRYRVNGCDHAAMRACSRRLTAASPAACAPRSRRRVFPPRNEVFSAARSRPSISRWAAARQSSVNRKAPRSDHRVLRYRTNGCATPPGGQGLRRSTAARCRPVHGGMQLR